MQMKAAVFDAPRSVRIENHALEKPRRGQVLVRLEGSGICGSDLPMWQGRGRPQYPLPAGRPGHEGWGIVSALGPGVDAFKIGDRVSGIFDGAFAELSVVAADNVIKLPRRLDRVQFPGEPLACALNAFKRSGIRAGDTVAVLGIGFLGAVMTQLANRVGARIVAVSRRDYALDVARKAGATHALHYSEDILGIVRELTNSQMCDVVVEATGEQEPLDLAGHLVGDRGRLVIVGYHQHGPRNVDMQLWNRKGIDVINAHERDPKQYLRGMREAIRLVAGQHLDPAPLFTHRFSLDRIGDGFRTLEERPEGFLKAVVEV